jgi:hypothetical protein
MTGDVKLGLLLGVGVVVAAALVYYRPEAAQASGKELPVKAQVGGSGSRTVQLSPPRMASGKE